MAEIKNKIPRNMATMEIMLRVDTAAGTAGTSATVYKNSYDGYRMQTETGDTYIISLSTLRNGNFIQIESMQTMPAEPATDADTLKKLREEYHKQYNRLYEGEDQDSETTIYCSLFEVWKSGHVAFMRAFVKSLGDFVTSYREYAAMMLALMNCDYTEKEREKKPRPIKTKTYNNFMRVMRLIMAKGYSKEEAEKMTHSIFDYHEARPFGLSILGLVELIEERPAAEEPTETAAEAPTESPAEEPAETPEEITEEAEAASYTARAWHNGEIIAEETIQAPNYERARAVARFLLSAGLYITVEPSENGKACENAPQGAETSEAVHVTTKGRKSPPRGAQGAAAHTRTRIPGKFCFSQKVARFLDENGENSPPGKRAVF